jgi:phage anti-repressor protein
MTNRYHILLLNDEGKLARKYFIKIKNPGIDIPGFQEAMKKENKKQKLRKFL